ncbi:MAG TPA: NAD(P)/FAD-dependent oxidoreductase [Oscillospiraceae bacterium]|nr:NAD(P)/FAD-dependent oxidoreductase [Oscillospiraceae bacterium]HPF56929.1 NAD(P)/FAD-dependent oxidoreductase [Clostridiales bacterium]HPK35149.1 NAD(P)/FAD-dependent oxidoreductase [Oscillospiraceae bacterium]HPR74952.1 NAD(P)/FAD-dependent oxidoreductase [Oscillospiraceae bacterium]
MAVCAVIGGGAGGMMAAGQLGAAGIETLLFEPNTRLGAKLRITGKGRCNLTNACDVRQFIDKVVTNKKFLFGAANRFSPNDCIAFFENNLGVKLKIERGGRVFPEDDNAHTVANALEKYALAHAKYIQSRVTAIEARKDGFLIKTENGDYNADNILIATGGMSYPKTGSTGDGYGFARTLGHIVTPLRASLVPLVCAEDLCRDLQGLSLKNTGLKLFIEGVKKPVYEEQGELLFTHFGVSGPLILSASAHLGDETVIRAGGAQALMDAGKIKISLDLKPALDEERLDARILRDFAEEPNRDFKNSLSALLPSKMIMPIVKLSGIPGDTKINAVTAEQRKKLVRLLKDLRLTVTGTRPIDEAVVTSGGVDVREVDPVTMESKIVKNLFFAGEVLDLDAYTGGYNLQIAFSTAVAAARAIINQNSGEVK